MDVFKKPQRDVRAPLSAAFITNQLCAPSRNTQAIRVRSAWVQMICDSYLIRLLTECRLLEAVMALRYTEARRVSLTTA